MDIHGCISEELGELQESFSVFRIVYLRRRLRAEHGARIEETTNIYTYIILLRKSLVKYPHGRARSGLEDTIKMDV
jgi:hypothetical protein